MAELGGLAGADVAELGGLAGADVAELGGLAGADLAELDWLGWVGWWGMILGSTNEKRRVRGHVFFSVSESGAYQAALIPR